MQAAERVVIAEGTERATVTAIAREAGVSLSALYRHFESREDLIRQAINRPLVEFTGACQDALAEATSVKDDEESLRVFIEGIYQAGLKHRGLMQTLLIEVPSSGELFATEIMPILRAAFDQIEAIGHEQASEQGLDQSLVRGNVRMITVLTMLSTLFGPRLAGAQSDKELVAFLSRFSAYGIRQAPPIETEIPGTSEEAV
jgi:AcrR family transcriptional regulator